jgi:hypothetical protein
VDITTVQPEKENVIPVVARATDADPFAEFDHVVRTGEVREVARFAFHMLLYSMFFVRTGPVLYMDRVVSTKLFKD